MNIKNKLRPLRDLYCYFDFFLNRGLGIVNGAYQIVKYMAFAGIIVEMINNGFNVNIPMDKVIMVVPVLVIILVVIGIFDTKLIHLLQKNNEINTRFNPYLVNLITKQDDENRKTKI